MDDAIQYGANEGISSPSRILYSFLQSLLLLNASLPLRVELLATAFEHWQTVLLHTRLIESCKCSYSKNFKAQKRYRNSGSRWSIGITRTCGTLAADATVTVAVRSSASVATASKASLL